MKYHKHLKFVKFRLKKLLENVKMEAPPVFESPQFGNVLENGDLFCPLYGHKCCFPDTPHLSCKFCCGKLARKLKNVET